MQQLPATPIGTVKRGGLNWALIAEFGTLAAFIVICIALSILAPAFLSINNFLQILRQVSVLGIVALSMTMVMTGGGIDLAIGEAVDVGALVSVSLIAAGLGTLPAILGGLLGGAIIGALKGTLIAIFGVMPFLATLGIHTMAISLQMAYTKGGLPIYPPRVPEVFSFLGRGMIGPLPLIGSIPAPVISLAVVFLFYWVLMNRSVLGRYIYSIGGNMTATRLSGVHVKKVLFFKYVLASMTAAFAGVILASRVSSGQPLAGGAYLLDAIAASFIGMTLSKEGKNSVAGTLLGAVFLGVVMNGMTLLNVVFYLQTLVKGALLLAVLALASYARTKRD